MIKNQTHKQDELMFLEQNLAEQSDQEPDNVSTNEQQSDNSVVSFFCGCGGLDLGFLGGFEYKGEEIPKLPFNLISAYDSDAKCIQTYNNNISDHAEVKDLSNFDPSTIPPAKVLIGGFPCQDFATCGPRYGLGSIRGRLYQALISYMDVHKPLVVIGENVPGLANMDQGSVLETIKEDIRKSGYKVEVWTLYAPDYGVPQRRTRLFIVAVREDLSGFPIPPIKTHNESNYLTAKWAINDLELVEDESISNQSQFFKAAKAKKGNGQGDEKTPANSPSYTIRANAKSRVQFHYSLDRRLTVRECARLQTFPDNFSFPHSATSNIMQIGNAVPPILANKVAISIAKYLEVIK